MTNGKIHSPIGNNKLSSKNGNHFEEKYETRVSQVTMKSVNLSDR